MTHTTNYQLPKWEKTDRVMMDDFNADNAKIDAALKGQAEALAAETAARKAADCYVKLMDLTLTENTQKWDIDMSGIDLTQYQKLVIYPRLGGNNDQWVYLHINETSAECGNVPMMNDPTRQNFGVCEYTLLIELPNLYLLQMGVTTTSTTVSPGLSGRRCPSLESGVTHLDTLNLWFNNTSYYILAGSTVQIYGVKR